MFSAGSVVFDRFEVIERIAFGAFSVIYKVLDKMDDSVVCLKVEILKDNPQSMIPHEFQISKLLESSYSCSVYEYFENTEIKAMTMELLTDNLANIRRKRKNPPSLPMLVNVTLQCLKALIHAHSHGVIYSDVKPSNFACRINSAGDYDVVSLDYGLSEIAGESENITAFRNQLKRNPRYLSLSTQNTGVWTATDDYISLLYTIADFWNDGLPWDGRTTHNLVLEVKDGYDIKKLLPEELGFLVDGIGYNETEIYASLEALLGEMERNVEQEVHYLLDAPDPGLKPKLVKYVFEKDAQKKFTNQHSA